MRSNTKFYLAIIVIITSVVYINILNNEFVWDDSSFIVNWKETRSLANIPDFLAGKTAQPGVYRPIRNVFYAFSYKLWGINHVGYHVQSILVHLVCTVLIFFISYEITKKDSVAFLTSLLFGVHPIHTEAITFITSSFDMIGVVFLLASFYLYIKSNKKPNLYYFSLIFALLAFFTYELALSLVLLVILYDFCFRKVQISRYIPYILLALIYLFIRVILLEIVGRGTGISVINAATHAFFGYIVILILPWNLNALYVLSDFSLSVTIFSVSIIIALIVIAYLFMKKHPVVSFSIWWFLIALLPVSNIIPMARFMAERYAYIASFGYCMILSYVIFIFYKNAKQVMIFIVIIIMLLFSGLTIARNSDWQNSETLWMKTVKQSPNSAIAHNNLGIVYKNKGQIEKAILEYKRSIELDPDYDQPHHNLGIAYQDAGRFDLALKEYQKALDINPAIVESHNNIGNIYDSMAQYDLAVTHYVMAIKLDPTLVEPHFNLGVTYLKQGKAELAVKEFKKALEINPELETLREQIQEIEKVLNNGGINVLE